MRLIIYLFFFFSLQCSWSQTEILLIGNTKKICPAKNDSILYSQQDSLPGNIERYQAIFLFSNAQSVLNSADQERILGHLQSGKGLYIGCENWPLQSEANQLTRILFGKEFWGNSKQDKAIVQKEETTIFEDHNSFSAGNSSVQFPLDFRLKTEAWIDDEPLIQSTQTFGGNLILDGGYSRFYCDEQGKSDEVWKRIVSFLMERSSDFTH